MIDLGVIRTALFVPGNRPDRVDKAVNLTADAIIIDLEDAVPLARKEETRATVREKLAQHRDRKLIVRLNGLTSGFLQGDLDEVVVDGLGCLVVPKVESPADIVEINGLLLDTENRKGIEPGTVSIIPQIESAKGVQNIFQIVSQRSDPLRIFTVAFGAADYTLDLGIEMTNEGVELNYARSRLPVACRAAGVEPPLDTPYMIDLRDIKALRADAQRAKQMGFQGKLCIHPRQIEPCNAIFSPTQDEIDFSRRVVQAFEEAEAKGLGAIQLEGKFIDYPIVERSRRIVRLAALIDSK
jgi:citrate lyase subunit beta/citryl-CoA lyase